MVSVAEPQDENCFNVEEAIYLLFSFQESCFLDFYFTNETLKAFNEDWVMSLATHDRCSMLDAGRSRNLCDAVRSFWTIARFCQRSLNESVSIL